MWMCQLTMGNMNKIIRSFATETRSRTERTTCGVYECRYLRSLCNCANNEKFKSILWHLDKSTIIIFLFSCVVCFEFVYCRYCMHGIHCHRSISSELMLFCKNDEEVHIVPLNIFQDDKQRAPKEHGKTTAISNWNNTNMSLVRHSCKSSVDWAWGARADETECVVGWWQYRETFCCRKICLRQTAEWHANTTSHSHSGKWAIYGTEKRTILQSIFSVPKPIPRCCWEWLRFRIWCRKKRRNFILYYSQFCVVVGCYTFWTGEKWHDVRPTRQLKRKENKNIVECWMSIKKRNDTQQKQHVKGSRIPHTIPVSMDQFMRTEIYIRKKNASTQRYRCYFPKSLNDKWFSHAKLSPRFSAKQSPFHCTAHFAAAHKLQS